MSGSGGETDNLIQHVSEVAAYSPPAHSGTVNRRLVGREFGAGFEMVLGQLAPGGEASRHYHVEEAQIVYILKGEADVALGDDKPRRCGPGTVIRIPKGLAHEVVTAGDQALEVLVLYAPPLGPDEEQAMRAGVLGEARRWAIEHQIAVGEFFDAADFVPVSQAHIMADTESLGEAGVRFLEGLAVLAPPERRVRVPTLTDPRGLDPATYRRLGQSEAMRALEARAIAALRAFGVLMTDTCINYQTIMPPVRGEHLAMGDTGVVIYSNSVFGARSNFEGGPSALAAGLTGRTPRYGYHLDAHRRPTRHFRLAAQPRDLSEWGALGGIVGRACGSYWEVPLLEGIDAPPGSDALKHFGTALASYGSVALFHMPDITPEAENWDRRHIAGTPAAGRQSHAITRADIDAFIAAYGAAGDKVDVVVFGAPQLSLIEMAAVADALDGRQVHAATTLLVTTSPEIKHAADRMGLTARIEASGAVVAAGICFYQSYAGEMAAANGWQRLLTNSAKLVNIIGGYGYRPTLASLERCVDSAIAGRVV